MINTKLGDEKQSKVFKIYENVVALATSSLRLQISTHRAPVRAPVHTVSNAFLLK